MFSDIKSTMFVTFLVTIALLLVVVSAQEYPKVPLDVYYEALCPSCQQFITTTLTTVWAMDDIVAITDLKMVPYGNTKKNEDGTFTCQHGPDECTTDVIEQCVLYELSGDLASIIDGTTSEAAFPFIQCMEFAEGDPSAATGCFAKTMAGKVDLDWPTVEKCTKTSELDVQNSAMKATPSVSLANLGLIKKSL